MSHIIDKPDTGAAPELRIIADAACTACGCVCDDITLRVENDRIVDAQVDCALAQSWFLKPTPESRPVCTIEGKPAPLADGIERAAQILTAAKYPLLYGLSDTTCEAQRVATGIADWIGGNVDTPTSARHGPVGVAFQGVGEVTCSLGEIKNRGDLIIVWGSNPVESHPRHLARYSLLPEGMFVPNGRKDRTCVVVDVRPTKTTAEADLFLQVKPGRDFEAIWTLRALLKGLPLDAAQVLDETGVKLSAWQDLAERMKRARFGVILFGSGLTTARGRHLNSEAIHALTRDMNIYTRFVCSPMRGPGNVTGADSVLTWRTGFPFSVNLTRGYPRFNHGEFSAAEMLARGEVDAAMLVATDTLDQLGPTAREQLSRIPTVTLGSHDTQATLQPTVAFHTATYGINTPGTVCRMDDVTIPLRPAVSSPFPSDYEVLSAIEERVRKVTSC